MRKFALGAFALFACALAAADRRAVVATVEPGAADDPLLLPLRYMIIGSDGRPVTGWIDGCSRDEGGIAGSPQPWGNCVGAEIYDALQVNENTGNREGGECIPAAAGSRYFFVSTAAPDTARANAFVEDFRYDAVAHAGAQYGMGVFRGVWNNNPPVPTQLYAILTMHDSFAFDGFLFNLGDPGPNYLHGVGNDGLPGWPGDGPLWTVIFDYGPVNAFTIYLGMEVCSGNLPFPADGEGAYTLALATAFDANTGQFTGALFEAQDQTTTTAPLGWAGPKYGMWGFRDDGGNPNGLARPGQPDVGNPPDEFTLWANDTNWETQPTVLWDGLNGEWFLLPILNATCLFSDTEVGVAFYKRDASAVGACCIGTNCVLRNAANCATAGGTFQGVGSACDPNPCAVTTGACCLGVSCQVVTQAACDAVEGVYGGNGSTCGPCPIAGTDNGCGNGDVNCDGFTNNFDIDPFVQLLTDSDGYTAAFPNCPWVNADINCDGVVNNFDIDPFVAALTGGGGRRCKLYVVQDGANTCPLATVPNSCLHACEENADCAQHVGFWTLTYPGPGGVLCSVTIRHGSVLFPPFCKP
ncbi:MAG: hypothetical protein JNG88_05640 [Phycisphaerales bacterium]|nr:hypothetical protein [Phycisphaerales bacterium]